MTKKIKIVKRYKQLPPPYFEGVVEEIKRQTDRGVAIIATAFLDLLLRHAIEKRMRLDPELHDLIFENRGPLQEFFSRIQVAFALKYIDLRILKDIRNAFAHSAEALDFNQEDIAKKCRELWFPRHIFYEGETVATAPSTPRDLFIRSMSLIADGLIEAEIGDGRIPVPDTFIQMGPPHYKRPPPLPKKRPQRPSQGHPRSTKKTDQ
jgi:hypothetical protein